MSFVVFSEKVLSKESLNQYHTMTLKHTQTPGRFKTFEQLHDSVLNAFQEYLKGATHSCHEQIAFGSQILNIPTFCPEIQVSLLC